MVFCWPPKHCPWAAMRKPSSRSFPRWISEGPLSPSFFCSSKRLASKRYLQFGSKPVFSLASFFSVSVMCSPDCAAGSGHLD